MRRNKNRLKFGVIYKAVDNEMVVEAKIISFDTRDTIYPFLVQFGNCQLWTDEFGLAAGGGAYVISRKDAKVCLKNITNSFNLREFTKIT